MTDPTRPLNAAERLDWLRLIRSENVGPVTFARLVERFGSPRAALAMIPGLAERGGRTKPIALCSAAAAERELALAAKLGAVAVCRCEPAYPAALRQVEDAPPVLYLRGNPGLLARPCVAVVGARNASANGCRMARQLARDLSEAGMVVVSGLARGIDTAAHQGALAGGTAAVLAGGVDVIYPAENEDLYHQIVAQGVAVSEMPPAIVPQASHFPRRNRIISGMARGVVVVEATARSGSLITTRLAADQGREVFAVPGSPLDPRCQGPNDLIRHGATLTESAADVLRVLDDLLRRPLAERRDSLFSGAEPVLPGDQELDIARSTVGRLLGPSPVKVDEIIRQCQLSPPVVSMVLLEFELAGRLERHPGQQVSLTP